MNLKTNLVNLTKINIIFIKFGLLKINFHYLGSKIIHFFVNMFNILNLYTHLLMFTFLLIRYIIYIRNISLTFVEYFLLNLKWSPLFNVFNISSVVTFWVKILRGITWYLSISMADSYEFKANLNELSIFYS